MSFDHETPLEAQQKSDELWKLTRELKYTGKKDNFVVPEDFETDFATVPRALTWLVPKSGRYSRAAVLHDYLLAKRPDIHRNDADGIFRRAMGELGVPTVRRYIMWGAVRLACLTKSATFMDRVGIVLLGLTFLAFVGLSSLAVVVPVLWSFVHGSLLVRLVVTLLLALLIAVEIAWVLVCLYAAEWIVWLVQKALKASPRTSPHFWWD